MNYSKGISWIDDCRIPFTNDDTTRAGKRTCNIFETEYKSGGNGSPDYYTNPQGRFPANLLCSNDMLNDGSVSKSSGHIRNNKKPQTIYGAGKGMPPIKVEGAPSDKGSNSRYYDIDIWFDELLDKLYLLSDEQNEQK